VDGGAAGAGGDARFAQNGDGHAFFQGVLQRAQLGVDVAEGVQLGQHQRVVALPEAMQVEDQPAEVPVGQLARLVQEARASARTPTRAEPGLADLGTVGGAGGVSGLAVVLRLRRGICRSRASYLIHA
jgi:hypothetical protein